MTEGTERWESRLVEEANVDPNTLVANDANWRHHPIDQRQAMSGVLDEVGWLQRIVVNRNTGRIVDGHMRVEMAIEEGLPTVPVQYVALSDDEERIAIATFDPVNLLIEPDTAALEDLLSLPVFDVGNTLADLKAELAERMDLFTGEQEEGEEAAEDVGEGGEVVPFTIYMEAGRHREFVGMLDGIVDGEASLFDTNADAIYEAVVRLAEGL